MKIGALFLFFLIFASTAFSAPAKDVCADDYWKWCAQGEAPFDCFKRRGFFKKESMLSFECKRAWSRSKQKETQVTESRESREQNEAAPQKLKAEPKRQPASELPKKEEPRQQEPDADDFSDLEFQ